MRRLAYAFLLASLAAGGSVMLAAQGQGQDHAPILIPDSSIEHAQDQGFRAHTNHVIRVDASPNASSGPAGQTPTTIRTAYGAAPGQPLPSTGGSGTIAIVDAFDYPTALSDFNAFSKQFGLPQETGNGSVFQVVYANASQPRGNCGWAQEAALDIEWAHAMAPTAKVVLVEAASNSFTDLFSAVVFAANLPNVKEVSMSWGGSEFSGENGNDSNFLVPGVVFFAASGDTGGATIYPGASPNVVAAGGTSLKISGGNVTETGWSGSGGGPSKYETRPSYQDAISTIVGSRRGVPDYSFDADPNTGVSVYDTTRCQGMSGWMVFGGTSVSSPSLAGIVNLAGSKSKSVLDSVAELTLIYGGLSNGGLTVSPNFRDITSGTAGHFTATTGWDFVTGVGSNQGLSGK